MADDSITKQVVCAVDLGGTNLRAANVDREGRLHEHTKLSTPRSDNPEVIVEAIADAVLRCEEQAAKRGARVESICVVVPGSVQAGTGLTVNAPNVPAIVNFKLAEALQSRTQRPVLIENDANAAALGEMWQGAARGCDTIVCLTLGTGVGSGIVLNGKLWRGIDGTAGEIGHASVDPFGRVQCKCGSLGCLEVCASATAIVRMTREGLPAFPESALKQIADKELTSAAVAMAAQDGDEFALGIFKRVGVYLGIAAANIVNTLNPEMIVIGGGVSASFNLFVPTMKEEMLKRAFPVPARRCQIVKAQCGDDAGLLGAAWLALANV